MNISNQNKIGKVEQRLCIFTSFQKLVQKIKIITKLYIWGYSPFVLTYILRNPMIGGLQGEFGDLDIKYLKQNV